MRGVGKKPPNRTWTRKWAETALWPQSLLRGGTSRADVPTPPGLVLPPGQPAKPLFTDWLARGCSVAVGRPGGFSMLRLSQAAFLQIQEASGLGAREGMPLAAASDHLAACNLGTEPAAGFR